MNISALGQAGLQGWREKVGSTAAPAVARRTPLGEEQVRAAIGVLFFALSVAYLVKAVKAALREARG